MNVPLQRLRELSRPNAGWGVLAAAVALVCMGIAAIDTTDQAREPVTGFAARQTLWAMVGLAALLLCLLPRPRAVGLMAVPVMILSLLLLAVITLPMMPRSIVPVINGARSWIDFQVMRFQPSEMGKVAFILCIAWYLHWRDSYRTFRGLLVPFGIMVLPVALILREPDLGNSMLLVPVMFAMLLVAGAKLRHLLPIIGIGVAAVVIVMGSVFFLPDSMQVLRKYQRDRIESMVLQTFYNDRRYAQSVGYQQDRAVVVVGAGGWDGYGADRAATMLRFNRIPENHTDMIFAVVCLRWGLVGGGALLGIFAFMILCMLRVAAVNRDPFARLAIVGFAALLICQLVINVGMALGILPVMGVVLPLVSYGGTSLLMCAIMVGLTVNFASRRPAMLARPSFEFDQVPLSVPRTAPWNTP